jgi:hypothetical protein
VSPDIADIIFLDTRESTFTVPPAR